MQAAADYLRTQNPWASEHRTPEILEVLEAYGAEAQVIIPHLEETAAIFDQGEVDFPESLSKQKAKAIRNAIQKIKSAKDHPELRSLKQSLLLLTLVEAARNPPFDPSRYPSHTLSCSLL